jgi:DNA-binding transcriptional regulator YiaG
LNTSSASLLYSSPLTCYSVNMTRLKRAAAQLRGLRCSYPPYWVAERADDGEEIVAMPGNTYEMLSKGLAPSAQESRLKLFKLRQKLHWSRSTMASFLGISQAAIRSYENGVRNPSSAVRRLIWLMELLANDPDQLKDAVDVIVWGKANECLEFASLINQ